MLSYRIFKKQKLSNFLLILQFVLSLLLFNLMLGNVNFVNFTNHAFSKIVQPSSYFYMPANIESRGADDYKLLKDRLTGVSHVSTIGEYRVSSEFSPEFTLFGYDASLYQGYIPAMEKGQWIYEGLEGGSLPVVVSEEFGSFQYGFEFPGVLYFPDGEMTVNFKITGVLKAPGMYLNLNMKSNQLSTNHLFRNHKAAYSGSPLFFINRALMPQQEPFYQASSIITFDQNLSQGELDQNLATLSERGNVRGLADILTAGEEFAKGYIVLYLPLFICGFSIAFVGMIGLSICNVQKNMRTFSIYYILGCKWNKVATICLGVTLIQLAVTTFVLGLVYLTFVFFGDLALYGVILNSWNCLAIVLVYLFVGLTTYLIPRLVLARSSAMDTFRANLQK